MISSDQKLELATTLFAHNAVKISTSNEPFCFSSGWASPVFVDMKLMMSFHNARRLFTQVSVQKIRSIIDTSNIDIIIGCELAGVPFSTLIADQLELPLAIAMKSRRGFGRLSQFEGYFAKDARALLVDDLTTDGMTKVAMNKAILRAQAHVAGTFVLFSYEIFPTKFHFDHLLCLEDLIHAAIAKNLLPIKDIETLQAFQSNPSQWSYEHGGIATLES